MPRVRDVLDRFRPAGAPGPATAVAVPADRRAMIAAELEPVFAALAATVETGRELRRAALDVAASRVAAANNQAHLELSRAQTDARALRAATAAMARAQAQTDTARRLALARAEAAAVRRNHAAHHADLVTRVLELVRADLRALLAAEETRR